MSKKQYFWISSFVILTLVGSVWAAFRLLEPKAIPKIKWSVVSGGQRSIDAIQFSLKPKLESTQFILVGVPGNHPKWISLLENFVNNQLAIQPRLEVFALEDIKSSLELSFQSKVQLFDLTDSPDSPFTTLGKIFKSNPEASKKFLILTSLVDSLSFNPDSRGGWLRGNNRNSIHIQFAEAISNRSEEVKAEYTCDTSGKLFALGRIGCEILNLSRLNYRKMAKKEGFGFVMSQISERDYLAIFRFQDKLADSAQTIEPIQNQEEPE